MRKFGASNVRSTDQTKRGRRSVGGEIVTGREALGLDTELGRACK